MKAWEIYSYQPPGWNQPHPAVLVSHPQRVANKPQVEVLMCTSQRASRSPLPGEVILDEADGLDWTSLCKCDLIQTVAKADLKQRRGQVGHERRREIIRQIIIWHDWLS
jgi:mRNA-degrading endonuclease toxin of MazEF toxin-antitoxin module